MTSTIKVNNIQNQCGQNIINENSNTITIGASGDTIALASGASQTGFGREGSVDWQTGSIKTTTFTATSGEGYFVDTSSGAVTANLPAGTAGAIVAFADYTRTFNSNNLTITPNGSNKIGGVAASTQLSIDGQAATFVFVDATEGWINVQNAENTEKGETFIAATGGTVTCSGNCRIHTFTGPGTFCVSSLSNTPANNEVSYLVVAGGGGGGGGGSPGYGRGGGGAGGFRESKSPTTSYTASPLDGQPNSPNRITVTATSFPIAVGGGGAGVPDSPSVAAGTSGAVSTFSTISSAGGGGGAGNTPPGGSSGGSGGGGSDSPFPSLPTPSGGGNGNTPPTTPAQGSNGGTNGASKPVSAGGGGGGATSVGQNAGVSTAHFGGTGGAGATTSITGSPVAYSGGGGGGGNAPAGPASTGGAAGGTGGGGMGGGNFTPGGITATVGAVNTGGGGGGGAWAGGACTPSLGAQGGSGIVVIRYKKA